MRLLPLLVLLAACAAPPSAPPGPAATPDGEPIDEPDFDAEAWIAAVEATDDPAALVALSADLLDNVDWRTACGEDDPTAPGRGLVRIHHLDADRALAEVTCQRIGAQSAFALVDARAGRPPRLVQALVVGEDGAVSDEEAPSFFGVFALADDDPPRFDVVSASAAHGGCGVAVRYNLRSDGGAAIVRVRAYPGCDDPRPPDAWPVTVAPDRP